MRDKICKQLPLYYQEGAGPDARQDLQAGPVGMRKCTGPVGFMRIVGLMRIVRARRISPRRKRTPHACIHNSLSRIVFVMRRGYVALSCLGQH